MANLNPTIYLYDGSFEGFLSCVFEVYENHEIPYDILEDVNVQQFIGYTYKTIDTDVEKSDRVYASVKNKICPLALHNIYYTFLSCEQKKGRMLLDYIRAGYQYTTNINNQLLLKPVDFVVNTSRRVGGEAHSYLGLVRFSELDKGVFYSEIQPKNNILPIIAPHFASRFSSMPWIIHDSQRQLCVVYNAKNWYITEANEIPNVKLSDNEVEYRKLWKQFYDTIEIKERHNERCRMSHMPKRHWRYLTELNTL